MGLDLSLVFDFAGGFKRSPLLAVNRLSLDRDYDLFSAIHSNPWRSDVRQVCDPKSFPDELWWYADEGIQKRRDDPYGSPLTFVTAGELSRVDLQSNCSAWNRSVFAMIRQLPPESPVVLWWH